jgi:hypothetical protein
LMAIVRMFDGEKEAWPAAVVSGSGLIGLAMALVLKRAIDLDIAALNHIAIENQRGAGATRSGRSRGSGNRPPR